MNLGVKTRTGLAKELGGSFFENVDTVAGEVARIRDVAEKHKIPMELLLQSLPGATEQMAAMERAARGESDEPPPPPRLIGQVGDKGVKPLLELFSQVGRGEVDRASAINTVKHLYAMDYMQASMIVPAGPGGVG